jgi:hypothetical protein
VGGKKLLGLEKSAAYRAADRGLIVTLPKGDRRVALPIATAKKLRGEG